ncbi:MAG: hypothetical protein ACR2NR_09805 [Solirubrobacteraceae bacterium]
MRKVLVLAGLCAVIDGGLSGCGGSSPATGPSSSAAVSSTVSASSSQVHRRRHHHRVRAPAGAVPVGRTQRVDAGDSVLSVAVTKVFHRLAGTGSALLPGTSAAGVQLTIGVDRGATYDSTASGDVSVVTSSGMGAPLFIKHGVCQTQLTDFESLIGAGETRTGCVGFTIPHGARIVAVRFSPHSRGPGSVSWR